MRLSFISALLLCLQVSCRQWTCTVTPSGSSLIDDAPAIVAAFEECNKYSGKVIITNATYHINTAMNITGLKNVDLDILGTMVWSTNITYWLGASLDVGYQNQSTAWILQGHNMHINGYGYGTLDGNGQTWYNFVAGVSNYPRRPHGITLSLTNSIVEGVRFVQSQMWTMSIIHSQDVLFDSIYVNSSSSNGYPARNTDGADTIYSSNLTFSNWIVDNGDDSISFKANSTDIIVKDCTFYRGLGVSVGSIGQYYGVVETVERISITGITFINTLHALYVKTWTGQQVGYPPNGGGGGLGYTQDVSITNSTISESRAEPFSLTQCTTFSGVEGNCTSSLFQIRNYTVDGLTGTSLVSKIALMKCADVKCPFITIKNVDIVNATSGVEFTGYECSNLVDYTGFVC